MSEVSSMTARRGQLQALAFASKGGSALSELLGSIATVKSMEREGSIKTMLFLETHFSDEEGHNIPVVGSKQGETGNLPYDRYTVEVKTQDGTRKVPGSWFTDVVAATTEGQRIKERIAYLNAAQGEKVPDDILAMGTSQKAVEKVALRQRLSDMRTALTKGSMLLHQCEAIGQINPARIKVKMPFFVEKGPDGSDVTVVKGSSIRLIDPTGEYEDEIVGVGQFLQYDAAKAKADADGGTLKSLKATAARAPRNNGASAVATAGSQYKIPTNVNDGLALVNVLSSWVDNTTDEGKKVESQLLTIMAAPGPESDETVIAMGKLCMALDSIWTVIQPRYDAVMRRKAATQMAAKV